MNSMNNSDQNQAYNTPNMQQYNGQYSPQYSDVNREIQNFLSTRDQISTRELLNNNPNNSFNNLNKLISILESLSTTYNEINTALKTDNSVALKDVILKSDIKMSLVCETLLETLRKTAEDKKRLIEENEEYLKLKREVESKEFNNKLQMDKLRNEMEFKKDNLEEMNRIISDQKSKMNEFKEESNKYRNESNFYKAKIEEIENLRNRSNERMSVYERELEGLSTVIEEKEENIKKLLKDKKDEENKNSSIKMKIIEIESILENFNKKIELKDKNLSLCNSELSKVLNENKKMKADFEKYKESSVYYEGLYKSLSVQNSYLNSELNKVLKNTEYNKDIEKFKMKYKRALKKEKKKVALLTAAVTKGEEGVQTPNENPVKGEKFGDAINFKEFQNTSTDLNSSNLNTSSSFNTTDSNDVNSSDLQLIKKIEDLNLKNKKYEKNQFKEKVKSILNEPKSFPVLSSNFEQKKEEEFNKKKYENYEKKYNNFDTKFDEKKYNNSDTKFAENYKINHYKQLQNNMQNNNLNSNLHSNLNSNFYTNLHNNLNSNPISTLHTNLHNNLNTNPINTPYTNPINTLNSNPINTLYTNPINTLHSNPISNPNNTYMKLFNLENDYEESKQVKEGLAGGFIQDSDLPPVQLDMRYSNNLPNVEQVKDTASQYISNNQIQRNAQQPVSRNQHLYNQPIANRPIANKPLISYGNQPIYNYKQTQYSPEHPVNNDSVKLNNYELNNKDYTPFNDNESIDSIKTFHTTSTLKEMMAKTDKLVQKFSDLETKLDQFKEGETVDKLTDKIRTYNSYYSDLNLESNESDYI